MHSCELHDVFRILWILWDILFLHCSGHAEEWLRSPWSWNPTVQHKVVHGQKIDGLFFNNERRVLVHLSGCRTLCRYPGKVILNAMRSHERFCMLEKHIQWRHAKTSGAYFLLLIKACLFFSLVVEHDQILDSQMILDDGNPGWRAACIVRRTNVDVWSLWHMLHYSCVACPWSFLSPSLFAGRKKPSSLLTRKTRKEKSSSTKLFEMLRQKLCCIPS